MTPDLQREPIHIISLGAGVQSSCMALMAAAGEITPMPECAIFADTGWEPKAVYKWLDWIETQLPFPVYRVSKGNLKSDLLAAAKTGSRVATIPAFTKDGGLLWRQCTAEYKIGPLQRKVKELAQQSVVWIGISTDEMSRAKDSREKRITHRWPLIDLGMSRRDCLTWMKMNGHPEPPRSACLGCPYHSDHEWRRIRQSNPAEWLETIEMDVAIRRLPGLTQETFLHRSRVPLSEVDFSTEEERGQINLFENECTGMCGV